MMLKAVTATLVLALITYSTRASAQLFGGGHHHEDASGHRVDDSGHHINNHGGHTGSSGVYDGDHSNEYYSTPSYSSSNYYRPSTSVPRTSYYSPSPSAYVTPNTLPTAATPAFRGEPIELKMPANTPGAVAYTLNDFSYTMETGQSQVVQSDRSWVIVFDRGGNFGPAKYSLSPGAYQFVLTGKGWDLQRQRPPQPQLAAAPPAPAPLAPTPASVSSQPIVTPTNAN